MKLSHPAPIALASSGLVFTPSGPNSPSAASVRNTETGMGLQRNNVSSQSLTFYSLLPAFQRGWCCWREEQISFLNADLGSTTRFKVEMRDGS